MRDAWLIAIRELRETVRDPNLVLPLVLMPCLIGLLAGISAFASFGSGTGGVGTAVTNAALDRLPSAAVEHLSNLPTTNRDATIETLLKAFSIPLFWVIPVALTPALAADSFVGERERSSLEPLLATPIGTSQLLLGKLAASVVPAAAGTWLGVLVFWGMTLLSRSEALPAPVAGRRRLALLAPGGGATCGAVHRQRGGAALDARQRLSGRVPVERSHRVTVVLLLIPATAIPVSLYGCRTGVRCGADRARGPGHHRLGNAPVRPRAPHEPPLKRASSLGLTGVGIL